MDTIEQKEKSSDIICNFLAMPVRQWLFILIALVFFLALCFFVFAGERFSF